MICKVAGADTHTVMPCHGKSSPGKSSNDGLTGAEGKDVAFAEEEQAHCGSSNKSEWDENGIGPVESGEDGAGNKGGEARRFERIPKTVRKVGIEGQLLYDAKGGVVQEMARVNQVMREAMKGAE